MNKIPAATARVSQPEFRFADEFLRERVLQIAKGAQSSSETDNRVVHWLMVAEIVKLYLTVLEALNEKLLDEVKESKGNLVVLNKFLALRQLAEAQLRGITQGSWNMSVGAVSSDEFRESVAAAPLAVSIAEVRSAVQTTDLPTGTSSDEFRESVAAAPLAVSIAEVRSAVQTTDLPTGTSSESDI